jgi:hypothetical protein
VLDGAAAAGAEMQAKRFDACSARLLDPDQLPPVGMIPRRGGNLDGLAAKRVGDEEMASLGERDAVAEMTDMVDDEAFNHGARR